MRVFYILPFIILATKAFSQPGLLKQIDSLQRLYETTRADSTYMDLLMLKGNTKMYTDFELAEKYADSAIYLAKKNNRIKSIASAQRLKGVIYISKGELSKALEYSYEALQTAIPLNNKLFNAGVYNNIGSIKLRLNEYDSAIFYFKRLLKIAKEEKELQQQAIALANLSSIYLNIDSLHLIKEYGFMGLSISQPNNLYNVSSYILFNIGAGHLKRKESDSALKYMELSLQVAKDGDLLDAYTQALLGLSNIYLAKKNYSKSISVGEEALKNAISFGALNFQEQILPVLSDAYDSINNKAKALKYFKDYIKVKDSVVGIQKKTEIAKKEASFEYEIKTALLNAEHKAAISKQKTIRNFSIAGIMLIALSAGLILWQYKKRRDTESKQKEAELQTKVAENEIKVLRLQMNPHFIFNSLNSVSNYIRKNNTEAADEYLTKFAKVMRSTLENSEHKEISLADELKMLEAYMELEARRLQNKFTYSIKVDEVLNPDDTLVPPMILQPFVENSIWHGISAKEGQGHINIHIYKEGKTIKCIIEDDGIGREKAAKNNSAYKNKSLGTKITASRLEIINKLKDSNANIIYKDKENGLIAELCLPFETAY
ncbi:MAG TPA: histidine kinase [Ferruginibacter sp.]|nr:histidine kinase [Ferruginibacter sp.]